MGRREHPPARGSAVLVCVKPPGWLLGIVVVALSCSRLLSSSPKGCQASPLTPCNELSNPRAKSWDKSKATQGFHDLLLGK